MLTLDRIQSALQVIGLQVLDLLPHDQSQLNLIVQIYTSGTNHWPGIGRQDRARRLEEEERLFRAGTFQLRDMVSMPNCSSAPGIAHHEPLESGECSRIIPSNADDL